MQQSRARRKFEETIHEIEELKTQIKAEIALAMPLEKAIRIIKSLKKQDLDVKSRKTTGKSENDTRSYLSAFKLEPRR